MSQNGVTRWRNKVANLTWYANNVVNKVDTTYHKRVQVVTELVKAKVKVNISKKVTRRKVKGKIVTYRSKPGQYPRLDTGDLFNSIKRKVVRRAKGVISGIVYSDAPHSEYMAGMKRKFIPETFVEMRTTIQLIMGERIF